MPKSRSRRLDVLEKRIWEPEKPSEAYLQLKDFLVRYAGAKRTGEVTEELEEEVGSLRAALRERLHRTGGRGEARR